MNKGLNVINKQDLGKRKHGTWGKTEKRKEHLWPVAIFPVHLNKQRDHLHIFLLIFHK